MCAREKRVRGTRKLSPGQKPPALQKMLKVNHVPDKAAKSTWPRRKHLAQENTPLSHGRRWCKQDAAPQSALHTWHCRRPQSPGRTPGKRSPEQSRTPCQTAGVGLRGYITPFEGIEGVGQNWRWSPEVLKDQGTVLFAQTVSVYTCWLRIMLTSVFFHFQKAFQLGQ